MKDKDSMLGLTRRAFRGIGVWKQATKQTVRIIKKGFLLSTALCFCGAPQARAADQDWSPTVKIDASQRGAEISPFIYGQFIEHMGNCINAGIWAEMLEDRKFFYPVGDKKSPWKAIYNCNLRMTEQQPFVGKHSPESFTAENEKPRWLGVWQNGLAVRKGKKYTGYAWIKPSEGIQRIEVHFHWSDKKEDHAAFKMPVKVGDFYKIEFVYEPTGDFNNVMLEIAAFGKGTFTVGCVSLMPGDNVNGLRADTLELLKRLNSPVYRWPGGNFVSGYDWKDGVGDRDKRPPRKNPAWRGVESNDFGINEFFTFCKILKTAPYIVVNTGNGNVENAVLELEYINGDAQTPMGRLRAKHGFPEPYNVTWLGIGNEMYGKWQIGHIPVEKYVEKHNAFVDAFRAKDPKVRVIGVGSVGKWNEKFLPGAARHLDFISEHFYVGASKKNVTEHVRQIPNEVKRIAGAHRKYRKTLQNFKEVAVPIVLDEWNYWPKTPEVFGEVGLRLNMKDGLGIAAGLHEFARQSDMYFMANYSMPVNVLGCIKASKTAAKMETTGLVLELYRNHFGGLPLKTEIEPNLQKGNPVDVLAALSGGTLSVGIINTLGREVAVKLDIQNFDVSGKKPVRFEIADPENNPDGFNDPDRPSRIEIKETKSTPFDGHVLVKPYSVTLLKFPPACGKEPVAQAPYNKGIHIIPQPQRVTAGEGFFRLNKNTVFSVSDAGAKKVAAFVAGKLAASTGFPLEVVEREAPSNAVVLRIDPAVEVNNEGYTLEVAAEKVIVKAKTAQGLFYGLQTFLQLLPAEVESPSVAKGVDWAAPCVSVTDEPRFEYRGILLDPCRHFIPVESIKKQLDVVALFKLNRMQLHLADDQGWRIEIKKYPKLTEVGSKRIEGDGTEHGGYYTQEQMKEIVAYAAERFITIVPEIEMPGHGLAAIAAYPELSCQGKPVTPRIVWGVEDVVYCAGKESTYKFLEDVIDELLPLFPGTYFHIGGDECPKRNWKACPLCQKRIREEGLKGDARHAPEERLQSYFVRRMEKFLNARGKRLIGFDEILEGGLAPSATVMSWRGERGGIAAAAQGHDVIMTPASNGMYLDFYQGDSKVEPLAIGGYVPLSKTYGYDPVPGALAKANKAHFIKGVQGNVWSEYLYTTDLMEYRIYPRILALGEIAWTQPKNKNYKDFERRVNNAYVRLDGRGIHYHIPQPEQPGGSCDFVAFTDKASLAFTTTRPIKVVYTTDGGEPTPESPVYKSPVEFTESGTLKIRSVLPSGKMSPVRVITVEKQTLSSAVAVENAKPGLRMQTTPGCFFKSGDIQNIQNWKSSVIKELRELTSGVSPQDILRNVNPYAAVATGYVDIPVDGVYYFSSDMEEVWVDGKLLISNQGEPKRFSRHDRSVALAKGLHPFKVVFLGHILGGCHSSWGNSKGVSFRKEGAKYFTPITGKQLFH